MCQKIYYQNSDFSNLQIDSNFYSEFANWKIVIAVSDIDISNLETLSNLLKVLHKEKQEDDSFKVIIDKQ